MRDVRAACMAEACGACREVLGQDKLDRGVTGHVSWEVVSLPDPRVPSRQGAAWRGRRESTGCMWGRELKVTLFLIFKYLIYS